MQVIFIWKCMYRNLSLLLPLCPMVVPGLSVDPALVWLLPAVVLREHEQRRHGERKGHPSAAGHSRLVRQWNGHCRVELYRR